MPFGIIFGSLAADISNMTKELQNCWRPLHFLINRPNHAGGVSKSFLKAATEVFQKFSNNSPMVSQKVFPKLYRRFPRSFIRRFP